MKMRNRGFTLPEVLVSAVIVTITALAMAQFLGQQTKIVRKSLSRGSCMGYGELVRSRLLSMGTRMQILDVPGSSLPEQAKRMAFVTDVAQLATGPDYPLNVPAGWSGTNTPTYISAAHRWPDPTVNANFKLWDVSKVDSDGILQLRSAHFINGTIAALTSIYRSDARFCTNADGLDYTGTAAADGQLLPSTFAGMTSITNKYLKIQYLDQANGDLNPSCPADLIIAPIPGTARSGKDSRLNPSKPHEDYGGGVVNNVYFGGQLVVTVTVDYKDNEGLDNRCTSAMRISYPPDIVPPRAFPGQGTDDYTPIDTDNTHVPLFDASGPNADDDLVESPGAAPYLPPRAGWRLSDPATGNFQSSYDIYASDGTGAFHFAKASTANKVPGAGGNCAAASETSRRTQIKFVFNRAQQEKGSVLLCRDNSMMIKKQAICTNAAKIPLLPDGTPVANPQDKLQVARARRIPIPMKFVVGAAPDPPSTADLGFFPLLQPPGLAPNRLNVYDSQYYMWNYNYRTNQFDAVEPSHANNPFAYGFAAADTLATQRVTETLPSFAPTAIIPTLTPYPPVTPGDNPVTPGWYDMPNLKYGIDPVLMNIDFGPYHHIPQIPQSYGQFVPCEMVTFCGVKPASTSSNYNGGTGNVTMTLDYGSVAEGYPPEGCLGMLEWAFIDTAGNLSPLNTVEKIIRVAGCGDYSPEASAGDGWYMFDPGGAQESYFYFEGRFSCN